MKIFETLTEKPVITVDDGQMDAQQPTPRAFDNDGYYPVVLTCTE